MTKEKIVLHACCAVCLGHPYTLLNELNYEIIVLFYNPNIYPNEEYERRKAELIRFCETKKVNYKILEDDTEVYYKAIKGFETEPEKGSRCQKCFELRLQKTAEFAKNINANYFTTTLSVSPHKRFAQIQETAKKAETATGIKYLGYDFKKQNGFLKTNEIAKEFNFYRQDYCGCKFSIRKK